MSTSSNAAIMRGNQDIQQIAIEDDYTLPSNRLEGWMVASIEATGANAGQIEFWNGWMADRWVAHQVMMDGLLAPLSEAVLAVAAASAGERVLDVGCGCGTTALAMAGAGARVTGIDVSAPMLSHARGRALAPDNPEFLLADASTHRFTSDHDLLFSRFGVMFFADPVAAFANLRAALRPGGRLCFLCWQRADMNPWVAVPMAAVRPLVPVEDPADPRAPGPFAFADPDYVRDVLTGAGFGAVELEALERSIVLGADASAAAMFVARIGPVSRVLAEMEERSRDAVLDALRGALAGHLGEDGVALGAACWIVTAKSG